MEPASPNLISSPQPLLWALFLGTSWTWCIGMFLPVLLIRDMGLWGWIVFAAPNVVGAALMGWVLKSPQSSAILVEKHGGACRTFSAVTIAFHVFFVLWFVPRLVGLPMAGTAFALTAIYLLFTFTRPGADLAVAAIAWVFSLVMFVVFMRTPAAVIPSHRLLPDFDALCLSPVCLLGFALCPYLDLTFHRARQSAATPRQSKVAFGVGFGVVFLVMIVFSAVYAGALDPLLAADWREHVQPVFGKIIAAHMIVQAALTMAFHGRSLAACRITAGGVFGVLILSQIAIFAALAAGFAPRIFNLDPGEVIYRLFLSLYGLVFPAYVWICILPRNRGGAIESPTVAAVRSVVLAVAVAAPMYWLGFLRNHMAWLAPGAVIVLLARYLVPRTAFPNIDRPAVK